MFHIKLGIGITMVYLEEVPLIRRSNKDNLGIIIQISS